MPANIQEIVASRLEDMAAQVQHLVSQGEFELAELIKTEGLELATAYDEEYEFFYIGDLRHTH